MNIMVIIKNPARALFGATDKSAANRLILLYTDYFSKQIFLIQEANDFHNEKLKAGILLVEIESSFVLYGFSFSELSYL